MPKFRVEIARHNSPDWAEITIEAEDIEKAQEVAREKGWKDLTITWNKVDEIEDIWVNEVEEIESE